MKKKVILGLLLITSMIFIINLKIKSCYVENNNIIGIYVDNELQESIPKKGEVMFSKAVCDSDDISYYWDVDNWGLFVDNLNKKTKCNLYFIDYSGQTVFDFDYTGGEQTFSAPVSGTYKLETWGAQGASMNDTYFGGYGGYSNGFIALSQNDFLYINVGSEGNSCSAQKSCNGGYNGGGNAKAYSESASMAGGGGGATHIAKISGLLSTLENSKDDILMVSAGGGGSNYTNPVNGGIGGHGGGFKGSNPSLLLNDNKLAISDGRVSYAATQANYGCNSMNTDCGSFGQGGNSSTTQFHDAAGSGGGAGYYGGSGANIGPGAGGSSYIGNLLLKNKVMYCYNCEESSEENTKTISTTCTEETPTSNCAKKGNGYARITLVSVDE